MLLTHRTSLLLIELKVIPFRPSFVKQLLDYRDDLLNLQLGRRLLRGEIKPYLLCTSASTGQRELAEVHGVTCLDYDPEEVLNYFYTTLKPIALFAGVKPIDIGIWNLHLVHRFIYFLEETNSVSRLKELVGGAPKTLYNKIRFATELRLVEWSPNKDAIFLSRLGCEYVSRRDVAFPQRLSEAQIQLLKKHVMQNPYESPVILGIAAIVESVFALAKNTHPVPMSQLREYFSYYAGKHFDWQTPKARYNATGMYANYAVDLGLLARSGDSVYLTPDGFHFTIQLQLHKSLKMVASV